MFRPTGNNNCYTNFSLLIGVEIASVILPYNPLSAEKIDLTGQTKVYRQTSPNQNS